MKKEETPLSDQTEGKGLNNNVINAVSNIKSFPDCYGDYMCPVNLVCYECEYGLACARKTAKDD